MNSSREIRLAFLGFFQNKRHTIVPSSPIVVKNDPTLMFTNAGMNQFKDFFIGNKKAPYQRAADTQKCLRVSGKHNDLEEVGVDHYHHTMFEMLGNWSFGDYFKEDALAWSWELLTDVYKIDKERLYVSVFEGDESEGLSFDQESFDIWSKLVDASHIIKGNKKDNFWEMGESGPCGPSSEIHVDLRSEEERKQLSGADLVNKDHPEVIEIWNNVFMEFNRKADGRLEPLPQKHVDTGMGFERLCRVLQDKKSNYDTDIFQPIIQKLEEISKQTYTGTPDKKDVAFRVIADHIRAVTFCIADGQMPSNTGAGYVIRRILRRALRYGYSYLGMREPFMYKLVDVLANQMGSVFPELESQKDFIAKVIQEEGNTFLKTLSNGLEKIQLYIESKKQDIDAKTAFELYDTFGFPIDLTQLIAQENNVNVDIKGFQALLQEQKDRSRKDAVKETGDWLVIQEDEVEEFIGYDYLEANVKIVRYRTVKAKDKNNYQLVFNISPFYAESGGQVGDTGVMIGSVDGEKIEILDTQKENDVIIHYVKNLPKDNTQSFDIKVDDKKRFHTSVNHSATHLLHAALKEVLGSHVAQKGSLVNAKHLRFDFSHFAKMTDEEIQRVEEIVNDKIALGIQLSEKRSVPIKVATEEYGATALFGEKYGDLVRVISFDSHYSVELCGGTHVSNTNVIRQFKIQSENSVAAGVRRIEAITNSEVDAYYKQIEDVYKNTLELLGNPKDLAQAVEKLQAERNETQKQLDVFELEKANQVKAELLQKIEVSKEGLNLLFARVDGLNAEHLKSISFQLKSEKSPIFGVISSLINDKPMVTVFASDDVVKDKNIHCGNIVRDLAKLIQGGGGGQPFFATAGGKDVNGLDQVIEAGKKFLGLEAGS
jgi:alanyl-tRNA synthetase